MKDFCVTVVEMIPSSRPFFELIDLDGKGEGVVV